MKPVARRNGLVVRDLTDEVVVYDLERHEAHCLNHTAAVVFRSADGRRSVSDLAALLSTKHAPEAEGLVEMALGQLGDAHLLESAPPPLPDAGLARRDVMRRVGIGAAVLLPLVTSILAPSPAEALASCVDGNGGGCLPTPAMDGTACHCGFNDCGPPPPVSVPGVSALAPAQPTAAPKRPPASLPQNKHAIAGPRGRRGMAEPANTAAGGHPRPVGQR